MRLQQLAGFPLHFIGQDLVLSPFPNKPLARAVGWPSLAQMSPLGWKGVGAGSHRLYLKPVVSACPPPQCHKCNRLLLAHSCCFEVPNRSLAKDEHKFQGLHTVCKLMMPISAVAHRQELTSGRRPCFCGLAGPLRLLSTSLPEGRTCDQCGAGFLDPAPAEGGEFPRCIATSRPFWFPWLHLPTD